jgi:hypothetical protein
MAVWYWAVTFVKLTSYLEGICTSVCLLERTLDPKSAPEGGGVLVLITDALFLPEFSAYPCFLTICCYVNQFTSFSVRDSYVTHKFLVCW